MQTGNRCTFNSRKPKSQLSSIWTINYFRAVLTAFFCITTVTFTTCKTVTEQSSSGLQSATASDTFKQNFLESFEFIDFFDMVVAMIANNPKPWERYDNDPRFQRPMLEKWRDAKSVLTTQGPLTEDLIMKVFRILREKSDGKYRGNPVVAGGDYALPEYAGQQGFFVISQTQAQALKQNPYLVTTIAQTSKTAPPGMVYARYEYPSFRTWQQVAALLSPSLISELQAAPATTTPESATGTELTAKILSDLVRSLLANAGRYTATQTYQYFISIHPFDDTNGRTARLLYYTLNNRKPLILRNFDFDTFTTVEEFSAIVKESDRQWDELVQAFNQEHALKTGAGKMPDYYKLDAPWLIAANRYDMLNKSCKKRSELISAARSFFNEIEIKQKIDHKDYVVLDASIKNLLGADKYICP